MRERFGCGLREFLFEPNTPTTRELLRRRIVQAIGRWEPRVRVKEVTVEADPAEPRLAAVTITFRLVATGALERLDMMLQFEG
jgi:phage baseplate assembly protein W